MCSLNLFHYEDCYCRVIFVGNVCLNMLCRVRLENSDKLQNGPYIFDFALKHVVFE